MLEFNFNPFPLLVTERLLLRRITMEDADAILFLRSDNDAMKYLDRPKMTTIVEARALIQKMEDGIENNEGIVWGICLKEDAKLIGTVGFHKIDKLHFRAEIGYILSPQFWRKGIVNEAVSCLLDFGFSQLKFHSIEAHVNPGNQSSINLLEKFNFVREAYFRENYFYDGRFLDSAVYSLLRNKQNVF